MDPVQTAEKKDKIFTLPFNSIMLADLCVKSCTYMQATLLPLYVIERNFSSTVAGLTSTAYMLASLLLRPVTGRTADEKGRYAAAIFGTLLYCVATGLYFFAVPVTILIAMRVLQGSGVSFVSTGVYVLATDYIPESRMAEGLGYLGFAQTLAMALASAVALLLKNSFGYQTAFVAVFALSAAPLIIILLLRFIDRKTLSPKKPETEKRLPDPDKTDEARPFLLRFVNKNALKPSLLMFLIMLAYMTVSIFLVPYATIGGIANPGIFFTAQAVMTFIARLTAGKIQRIIGSTAVLISGILILFLGLISLVLRLNLPLILFSGACCGLGYGVLHPQLSALAVLAAGKDNRGMGSSTFFMMMDAGTAVSGFFFGAIADIAGYASVYAIAAFVSLSVLLLFLIMRKRGFAV